MKIVSVDFEIVRATPAVAEFVARVELDGPAAECELAGHAVGPRCAGISTVEVSYPMTVAGAHGAAVILRCVIPEPNLWAVERPNTYRVVIELRLDGRVVDERGIFLALRGR
jgi:hypothetical protein